MKQILKHLTLLTVVIALCIPVMVAGQEAEDSDQEKEGYKFTIIKELPATPVKNQYRSGTCWSFASTSLLESELLRMDKGGFDLSEMFIVRKTYLDKARRYVRWHGNINFGSGGAFHDAAAVFENAGIVPEDVYGGKVIGEEDHVHGEMDGVLQAYVDAVIKNRNRKLTPIWCKGFHGILDAYLGEIPESFIYNGTEYTPMSFAADLGLEMDDYVEIGSYSHHPFYEEFILEVPDNWMFGKIYNVPLEDMMHTIDHAIENGYTVAWGADVSEKGFSWKNGIAIVPETDLEDMTGTERERWESLSDKEQEEMLYKFEGPGSEKDITQAMRQEAFDNYQTTDDHSMHITGIAEDQDGNQYYIVKNSWGTDGNDYEGYLYASKSYVAYKTLYIWLHEDAVPKNVKKELGF